jgi:hypothetical protein
MVGKACQYCVKLTAVPELKVSRMLLRHPDHSPSSSRAPTGSQPLPSDILEGTLLSVTGNHLAMLNLEGERVTQTLVRSATVTCDRIPCEVQDLSSGIRIRVTTQANKANVALSIESILKDAEFTN